MLHRSFAAGAVLSLSLGLVGCENQSQGFVLPPGDVEKGKIAYVDLGCGSCHVLQGVFKKLPPDEGGDEVIEVVLGGPVSRVKTYGDLVTSIINPSHRLPRGTGHDTVNPDGTSKMPYYNDVMSVQELVDLTTLLQTTYSLKVPEYSPYYLQ